jgi:hypothetical protein
MTEPDDPIADAYTGESDTAERVDALYRSAWLKQSIPKKLLYIALLIGSFTLSFPLLFLYPDESNVIFESASVYSATPLGLLLALLGITILVGAALGLFAVSLLKRRAGLSEDARHSLLVVEDMVSLLAFVPGAFAIVYTEFLLVIFFRGEGAVEAYTAILGTDPTTTSGAAFTLPVTAVLALIAAASVYALSQATAYLQH